MSLLLPSATVKLQYWKW